MQIMQALLASVLPIWLALYIVAPCEAAGLLSHSTVGSSGSGAGAQRTSLLRAAGSKTSEAQFDAITKESEVVKFGPQRCISTWKNSDGHCEVATKCQDEEIKNYSVKLICVDSGEQKVRHSFAAGSFDSEEQFDTLIECEKCLADKEEMEETVDEDSADSKANKDDGEEKEDGDKKEAPSRAKKEDGDKKEDDDEKNKPLQDLKDEVRQLEAFMMSTSDQVQALNKKVYSGNFEPIRAPANAPAMAPPSITSSLVNRAKRHSSHRHHRPLPLRQEAEAMRVRSARRKVLAEGAELDEDFQKERRREALRTPGSLATVEKLAEERDVESSQESNPIRLPVPFVPESRPVRPAPQHRPMSLVRKQVREYEDDDEADEDADEDRDGDDEDDGIPHDADAYERQEEEDGGDQDALLQQSDEEDSRGDDEWDEDASE